MKIRSLLFILLLALSFSTFGQLKLKRVVNKSSGYPRTVEIYRVIKKGEHKGKMHGQYSNNQEGNSISGKYHLGQKDEEWKYDLHNNPYTEYYNKGALDSSKGKLHNQYFELHLNKEGDTTTYETWHPNGVSFSYKGDTTFVYNKHSKLKMGTFVNGKRDGEWNWQTDISTANTYHSNGLSIGTHTSHYKSGSIFCIKNYNKEGNLNGTSTVFYENGDTANIQHYMDGDLEGITKAWYPNKSLFYEGVYKKDRLRSYKEFSSTGKINILSFVEAGFGTVIKVHEDDTLVYPIANGMINGEVTKTTKDSISKDNYINGVLQLKKEDNCSKQEDIKVTTIELNYQMLDSNYYRKANFKNDERLLQRFIAENITFPSMALENDIQGKIIAMFVVNRLGKLNHLETCNKTLGFGLEKESMRVLEATSYLWTPAIINGFPANMRFRIPVKYQIF
ncbi:MAG: hypothetical protein ACJAR8_002054 [Bacteroidia bacterium]|jgi:hypothetical protein